MRWLPDRGIGVIALGNSTYAPMSMMARRMLEIIDDHGLVPAAPCQPSAALVEAAQRLATLLSSWNDAAANELFADNVALDDSFSRRFQLHRFKANLRQVISRSLGLLGRLGFVRVGLARE